MLFFRGSTLAFSASLLLRDAEAWGPEGHTIVAHVADSFLSTEVGMAVTNELGPISLTDAATWCDDFDHSPPGKWSAPLHYINYPGQACSFDWSRDCANNVCIAGAISNYSQQVFHKNFSTASRLFALKFLIHMVGDLHQPMHVGSTDDRGGNDIKVKVHLSASTGLQGLHGHSHGDSQEGHENDGQHHDHSNSHGGHGANLHQVWDSKIIEQDISELEAVEGKTDPDWVVLSHTLIKRMKGDWSSDMAQWQEDVASQSDDTLRAGLTNVALDTATVGCTYAYQGSGGARLQTGDDLERDYYERTQPIVEQQLAKAGARLAQMLTDAYALAKSSDEYQTPILV